MIFQLFAAFLLHAVSSTEVITSAAQKHHNSLTLDDTWLSDCPVNTRCYALESISIDNEEIRFGDEAVTIANLDIHADVTIDGDDIFEFEVVDSACTGAFARTEEGVWESGVFRCGQHTELLLSPCKEEDICQYVLSEFYGDVNVEGGQDYSIDLPEGVSIYDLLKEDDRSHHLTQEEGSARRQLQASHTNMISVAFRSGGNLNVAAFRAKAIAALLGLNQAMAEYNVNIRFFLKSVVYDTRLGDCESSNMGAGLDQCGDLTLSNTGLPASQQADLYQCGIYDRCSQYSGLAWVPGRTSVVADHAPTWVLMHEILHNMNLNHNNMYYVTDGIYDGGVDILHSTSSTFQGQWTCSNRPSYAGSCPNYYSCHDVADCSCLEYCQYDSRCCSAGTTANDACNYVSDSCPNYYGCHFGDTPCGCSAFSGYDWRCGVAHVASDTDCEAHMITKTGASNYANCDGLYTTNGASFCSRPVFVQPSKSRMMFYNSGGHWAITGMQWYDWIVNGGCRWIGYFQQSTTVGDHPGAVEWNDYDVVTTCGGRRN